MRQASPGRTVSPAKKRRRWLRGGRSRAVTNPGPRPARENPGLRGKAREEALGHRSPGGLICHKGERGVAILKLEGPGVRLREKDKALPGQAPSPLHHQAETLPPSPDPRLCQPSQGAEGWSSGAQAAAILPRDPTTREANTCVPARGQCGGQAGSRRPGRPQPGPARTQFREGACLGMESAGAG